MLPKITCLYEKVLAEKLEEQVLQNKVIPPTQYGFRAKKGVLDNLGDVLAFIGTAKEKE
jgi:hypothetical protein